MDMITYALSKRYTSDTAKNLGSLKGAACEVADVAEVNGGTQITLQWTGSDGTIETQSFVVANGVSPTAVVSKEDGKTTITVTDETGTTSATVLDGTTDNIIYTGSATPSSDAGYKLWVDTSTDTIKYWNATSKTWEVISSSSGGGDLSIVKVNTLPTSDINSKAIYIVPSKDVATSNKYEEYLYINGTWELLGSYESEKEAAETVLENSAITTSDIDALFN